MISQRFSTVLPYALEGAGTAGGSGAPVLRTGILSGEVVLTALVQAMPDVITDRGKPVYALLSIDKYCRILAADVSLVDRLSMDGAGEARKPHTSSPLRRGI